MKKRKLMGVLGFLAAVIVLFGACRAAQTVQIVLLGTGGRVLPTAGMRFAEPEGVDFEVNRPYYAGMTPMQQQAYRIIYNALPAHPEKILLPKLPLEEVKEVLMALRLENPQVLCLRENCACCETSEGCWLLPEYAESAAQCAAHTRQMLSAARSITARLPAGADDFNKELFVHDELCARCEYGGGAGADTAYGALVLGRAYCGGYAAAAKLLFDMAGVPSAVVGGAALTGDEPESHVWNAVRLGGAWYYTDVTWDDPADAAENDGADVWHAYFNVGAGELSATHTCTMCPESVQITGGAGNYYVRRGLYCRADDWRSVMALALAESAPQSGLVEVKFESRALFNEAKADLFENGGIRTLAGPYLTADRHCSYAAADGVLVLQIRLA